MELRQLEYLVAVTEEANFTRAAKRLHVAQPGVSAQIRALERELGQTLLDRSGRVVVPTEAGAAVLPYARAALAAVRGVQEASDELAGLLRGRISIGTVSTVTTTSLDLPHLLADFHRAHPAVEMTLSIASSGDLIDSVRSGRIDLGFLGLGTNPPDGVTVHVVVTEPLVAVVGRDDPLAAVTDIDLAGLAERALISLPPGTGLRACLDEAATTVGFTPHISLEAGDPRTLADFAAYGLGVAIVPRSLAHARQADLHTVTITSPEMRGRIALAWRTEGPSNPAARELITRIRKLPPLG